jgi:hypothetical protein
MSLRVQKQRIIHGISRSPNPGIVFSDGHRKDLLDDRRPMTENEEWVREVFAEHDDRFGTTWTIPWKKVRETNKGLKSWEKNHPNVDFAKGGLLQLMCSGAADYACAYRQLAAREVLRRKLRGLTSSPL